MDLRCPQCGELIPDGASQCPRCVRRPLSFHEAETVLGLSVVGLAVLFAVTGFAVSLYHAKYESLGREWHARGEADLNAGKALKAVVDFRTALVYARDSDADQLDLARALMAANRSDEAKAYLTSMWDRNPGNAVVNLELGRLAASERNTEDALRYYHYAMYGDWGNREPAEARRAARLELYQYLIKENERPLAEAELVAMAALLPPDPALYTQVGQLFLGLGDYARAANEFEGAVRLGGGEAALAGAGEAEFSLGDYRQARRYLERALREKPDDARLSKMLDEADRVLNADPYEPGLGLEERNRRVIGAFQQALTRLGECGVLVTRTVQPGPAATSTGFGSAALGEEARSLQPSVNPTALRHNPDLITEIMSFVFRVEQLPTGECGPADPLDRALAVIAQEHGGTGK
jgi:tetratricopeptide (TPR) repeat protein